MRRGLLMLAFAAVVIADFMFLPGAFVFVWAGLLTSTLGLHGHSTGHGSLLLGGVVLTLGGAVMAVVLFWLTRRTYRALQG
jgi:hypothetical protein